MTLVRAPPAPSRIPEGWPGCASTVGAAPRAPSCGPEAGRGAGVWKLGEPDPIPPGPWRQLWAPGLAVRPSQTQRPDAGRPSPTCGRGCAARGGRCAGSSAAPVRSGRGAAPGSGRAALPGSSVPPLRASRPQPRRAPGLPRAGAGTRGGGRGAPGAGPGRGSPPSPGRGAAAPPRPPAPAPRPLRSPPRLPSPFSHFPCLSPHRPGLPPPPPPVLSFSSLFSAPPHPPRPLASPRALLTFLLPSPSVWRPLSWFGPGVCVSVPVLCHKDFPRGFSPPSPADLPCLFSLSPSSLPVGRQALMGGGWRVRPCPLSALLPGAAPLPRPASMPANAGKFLSWSAQALGPRRARGREVRLGEDSLAAAGSRVVVVVETQLAQCVDGQMDTHLIKNGNTACSNPREWELSAPHPHPPDTHLPSRSWGLRGPAQRHLFPSQCSPRA